jgi:2-polyprenyl-6-methoxyphenol hydroxylase-like FAD-dependent oxidoreductase
MRMAKVLIIGAGICGLGAAILLARDGHDVTVIERDDHPIPLSAIDAWESWQRKGVAQFRQPHNFMPGLRAILEAELPDIQDALKHAGASRFDLLHPLPAFADQATRPIDDRLWTYTARRPVGEWVFSKAAQNEQRLTLRRGVQAVGLLTGTSLMPNVPHITGVRTAAGEDLRADFVIDVMGRGSSGSRWLAAIGARTPYEEKADCGFTYFTRYFRGIQPQRTGPILMPHGTISVLTLPADNDTWSVTLFTASDDAALKGLRHEDAWMKTVRAFPLQAHWLNGTPFSDISTMSGIVDRYKRLVVEGSPVATGLVSLADAWACTNPSAGRGLTVGLIHAVLLRDVLRQTADDPLALAMRFDEMTESEVAPWYRAQIAMDKFRFAQMSALREGREPPPPADDLTRQCASLFASMTTDPDLFRAGLEYIGTLTPIQRVLQRPEIAARVAKAMEAMRGSGPPPLPGPSRAELIVLATESI